MLSSSLEAFFLVCCRFCVCQLDSAVLKPTSKLLMSQRPVNLQSKNSLWTVSERVSVVTQLTDSQWTVDDSHCWFTKSPNQRLQKMKQFAIFFRSKEKSNWGKKKFMRRRIWTKKLMSLESSLSAESPKIIISEFLLPDADADTDAVVVVVDVALNTSDEACAFFCSVAQSCVCARVFSFLCIRYQKSIPSWSSRDNLNFVTWIDEAVCYQ